MADTKDTAAVATSTIQPNRDQSRYQLQTGQPVTGLGQMTITPSAVSFAFETWALLDSFTRGDNPIDRLRKQFSLTPDEMTANEAVLDSIREAALVVAEVGGRNFTLMLLAISTVGKTLTVTVQGPDGNETRTLLFDGSRYDDIMTANQALVADALTFAWTYGKTNDDYLAALTAV